MKSVARCHRIGASSWPSPRVSPLFSGWSNAAFSASALREMRRYGSGGGDYHSTATDSSPKVSQKRHFEQPGKGEPFSGDLPPIIDTPAPPRPAFYVPPEKRDPADESLAFLKPGSPLQHLAHHETDAPIPDELDRAPSLAARVKPSPTYMDADAARVRSTSVHAGQPLLSRRSVVDTSSYYYSAPQDKPAQELPISEDSAGTPHRRRLHTLQGNAPLDAANSELAGPEYTNAVLGSGGRVSTSKEQSIFTASHEFAAVDKSVEEMEDERQRAAPKPAVKQLESDIKKLEYYYGTPQYEKLLAEFRRKYGDDVDGKSGSSGDADAEGGQADKTAAGRAYTATEIDRGLESQPIDYLRGSPKLQAQLISGPRAYDPVTIMQQQGVMRFQGYAFPPTVELGKLKGDKGELKALHDAHKTHPLVARLRKGFNAITGRQDARDDYVAMEDKSKEDTHLMYRTLGLDAVQRRQMRYMLTDFDHADRHTAFHVMMSYPYTDWIHVFYMVLVGWCLYQLQVRYGAYEFYDEYLGLDLRQVPRLQKPVLAGITVVVMVFILFQPLLVASIASTRAYRIVMRRPIGPP